MRVSITRDWAVYYERLGGLLREIGRFITRDWAVYYERLGGVTIYRTLKNAGYPQQNFLIPQPKADLFRRAAGRIMPFGKEGNTYV